MRATASAMAPRGRAGEPVPSSPSTTIAGVSTSLSERSSMTNGQRERALGDRVGRLRLDGFDDADGNAGCGERARDDPRVAAIVARAREHDVRRSSRAGRARSAISAAAAAPARCMSARDGIRAAIAAASRAADCSLLTT